MIFHHYSIATGVALPPDPTQAQRQVVETWLRAQRDDALVMLGAFAQPSIKWLVNLTTSNKANRLVSLTCPTCGPTTRSFPVDVDPWSAQSQPKLKVQIREAVSRQLKGADASSESSILLGPVCISIVAVVPMGRGGIGRKDTDNLAKGLLDALTGIVYSDDKQVQCLTIRRLEYAGSHGHYMVGIREAEDFRDDVLYEGPEGARILWAPRSEI